MIARLHTFAAQAEEVIAGNSDHGDEGLLVPRRESNTLSAADVLARDVDSAHYMSPNQRPAVVTSIDPPHWDRHTAKGWSRSSACRRTSSGTPRMGVNPQGSGSSGGSATLQCAYVRWFEF